MSALKKSLRRTKERIVNRLFQSSVRLMRKSHPEWAPRLWSNRKLEQFGALFSGSVVNVSAWRDEDKYGRCYEDYFPHRDSYSITNYGGPSGNSGRDNEISLDLEQPLDESHREAFDVVFNHTTLEHVSRPDIAFSHLCSMSRDIVIIVVPFMQVEHWIPETYSDYYRFSEFAIRDLFKANHFELLHIDANYNPVYPVYYFAVGSRFPDRWREKFSNVAPLPENCNSSPVHSPEGIAFRPVSQIVEVMQ